MISRYRTLSKISVNQMTLFSEIETLTDSLAKYVDFGLVSVSGNVLNSRFLLFLIEIWYIVLIYFLCLRPEFGVINLRLWFLFEPWKDLRSGFKLITKKEGAHGPTKAKCHQYYQDK